MDLAQQVRALLWGGGAVAVGALQHQMAEGQWSGSAMAVPVVAGLAHLLGEVTIKNWPESRVKPPDLYEGSFAALIGRALATAFREAPCEELQVDRAACNRLALRVPDYWRALVEEGRAGADERDLRGSFADEAGRALPWGGLLRNLIWRYQDSDRGKRRLANGEGLIEHVSGILHGPGFHDLLVAELMADIEDKGPIYRRLQAEALLGSAHGSSTAEDTSHRPISANVPGEAARDSSPLSNVDPPDEMFTGRYDELTRLSGLFQDPHRPAIAVIHALGGMGKTSLAVEFAELNRDRYQPILFVEAADGAVLRRSFASLTHVLRTSAPGSTEDERVGRVWSWLLDNDGWLLILDGADEPDAVRDFFDQAAWPFRHGHILVTSRRRYGGWRNAQEIRLGPLSPDDAVDFLFRRTGRTRESAGDEETHAAYGIARDLSFLPLALEQVAAHLCASANAITFVGYLDTMREYRRTNDRIRLLDESKIERGVYRHHTSARRDYLSVATTWNINFEQLERKEPVSADLLRLLAFVDEDAIYPQLIVAARSRLTGAMREHLRGGSHGQNASLRASWECGRLFKPLEDCSFVEWRPRTKAYGMHRLLQEVVRDRLASEAAPQDDGASSDAVLYWVEQAARVVDAGLRDKLLEPLAAPSAYHLAEVLRPWINAEDEPGARQWTGENWERVRFGDVGSPFEDYCADHLVLLSQSGEVDWSALIYGREDPTYRLLHRVQDGYWQGRLRRMMAAVGRVPDPILARTLFCCVYFVTHYWWDLYLEGDHLVDPLLRAWEDSHPGGEEQETIACLRSFQEGYPAVRSYHWRRSPSATGRWVTVREAVRRLRAQIGLTDEPTAGRTSAHRYADAITRVYLAEALRYAPDQGSRRDEASIQRLYEQARATFRLNGDSFHAIWALHDQAESLSEQSDLAAVGLCLTGIDEAVGVKVGDPDDEDLDAEVVTGFYRILADVAWNSDDLAKAIGHLAAACVTAYAWRDLWNQVGDRYAMEWYGEHLQRLDERVAELEARDPECALRAKRFVSALWQGGADRDDTRSPGSVREVLPTQPNEAEVVSSKGAAAYLLGAIHARTAEIRRRWSAFSVPESFETVLDIMLRDFPKA